MSTRELLFNMIDSFTDEQLEQVLLMLRSVKRMLDEEAADDAFCEQLAADYLADPDPEKHDSMSLDDFAKSLGFDPEELKGTAYEV